MSRKEIRKDEKMTRSWSSGLNLLLCIVNATSADNAVYCNYVTNQGFRHIYIHGVKTKLRKTTRVENLFYQYFSFQNMSITNQDKYVLCRSGAH